MSSAAKEMLNAVGKRIQQVRGQYANIMKLGKNGSCYSQYCNMTPTPGKIAITPQSLTSTCYSPICLQKARLKRDLITLLRKANALNNNQVPSHLSQNKTDGNDEAKDAIRRDLESAVATATHCTEEFQTINVTINKSSNFKDGSAPSAKRAKLEHKVCIII